MFKYRNIAIFATCLSISGCKVPALTQTESNKTIPAVYSNSSDTTNTAVAPWRIFFTDVDLANLIDTALSNNQELMITLQEIEIARNETKYRKGAILPKAGIKAGAGVEKVGRYTSQGAGDASTEITPGKEVPDPLQDYTIALNASWEVDIWKKLRNAKKAAIAKYLGTIEGKNFVLSNLVAEVANSYYELLALDNQLEIVRQNIELQNNALEIVKIQKDAAKVTELAVQKFQAEVLKSKSLEYDIRQKITETENKVNLLLGRYPQRIQRSSGNLLTMEPRVLSIGIPSQLLQNRPDIKRSELEVTAAKLDVKVARAEFYPSLDISAALGLQAFRPSYLTKFPESLLYSIVGDLAAPLINRSAIKAEFGKANARQLQALYEYERTILNAYLEVSTQLANISNLQKSYNLKSQQVDALVRSITISNDLFRSARADYMEVLMTQRDALESKFELVETKKQQLNAMVNLYHSLGGGWR